MAKRFTPEQERILNEWARTASELRRAFTYTTASNTQTQGFGYHLNKEVDPDGRFYIEVRESDGTPVNELTSVLTFSSDSFYLERTTNPRELTVNFRPSGIGVIDHGGLAGLGDDDHPQYARKEADWNTFRQGITAEAFYLEDGSNIYQNALLWEFESSKPLSVSSGFHIHEQATAPATPGTQALVLWAADQQGHTVLSLKDNDGIAYELTRDSAVICRNSTGVSIPKGTPVYVSGATGGVPEITPADADFATTMPAFGLTNETIANNAFGHVMIAGVIESIDTSAFSVGDSLWVSSTAGGLTTTRPTHPALQQRVAIVLTSGVGNGSLLISGDIADPTHVQTISDGANIYNDPGKLSFNKDHFYLSGDLLGEPVVNLSSTGISSGTVPGQVITLTGPSYENVSRIRFDRDDFYLRGTSSNLKVHTGLVRAGGRPGGQTILGGHTTSGSLVLKGNQGDSDAFIDGASTSGTVTLGNQLQFAHPSGSFPSGTQTLIQVPASVVQDGRGSSLNIFLGFRFDATTLINSAQSFTSATSFISDAIIREVAAITSAHSNASIMGFTAQPEYRIGHNGASTAAWPLVAGFSSDTRAKRQTGNIGTLTVSTMAGFITNTPNTLRAFFGAQQLGTGVTVSKYAHFLANSNVTGGLILNGGVITEEVGIDLQGISQGITNISLRSTSPTAKMIHEGPIFTGNGINAAGEVHAEAFYLTNLSIHNTAIGVELETPSAQKGIGLFSGSSSLEVDGVTGVNLNSASSVTIESATNTDYISGGEFQVNAASSILLTSHGSSQHMFMDRDGAEFSDKVKAEAFYLADGGELSSGLVYVQGRYSITGEGSYTLSSDQNNYNPDSSKPLGFWRLTASGANRTITGIQAAQGVQYLDIVNVGGSNNVILNALSGSSSAANQITFNGTTCTMEPNEAATLLYDTTSQKWRVVSTTGAIA